MFASSQIAPSRSTASAVSELLVNEVDCDMRRVAIPRPEIHLVVRFGPATRSGLDVSALGVREKAHRKLIRSGQRTVMARLQLGAHVAVLGVPASVLAGQVVALEDLWGDAAARRLCDQLAAVSGTAQAAVILERAIAERAASARIRSDGTQLALASAALLASTSVSSVASELGVSERHLRRVFRETLGVSPKTFSKLTRFQRALSVARKNGRTNWANIAAASGYYDQAHLIAEFRTLSGVTPQTLLEELRAQAFES
ncbi:MAG TPA: helix-turn-helix domain-containing protein [Polyangiales bacterium]|nr:helix-turn-helix domain-containing protein [Polyangiales bacterium]